MSLSGKKNFLLLRYRQSKRVVSSEKPQLSALSEVFDIFYSGQSTDAGSRQAVRNVITMNNCTIWKTSLCNCCNRHTQTISKSFLNWIYMGITPLFFFYLYFTLLNTLRHIPITPFQNRNVYLFSNNILPITI